MILFYDVETTGLPDFNKRARDPSQPHIVQLAAIVTDEGGKVLEEYNVLCKPDGWTIRPELTAIHGITNERAFADGVPEGEMASKLLSLIKPAKQIAAFNVSFDKYLARIAMRRYELIQDADDEWWKGLPTFCVMKPLIDIVKATPMVRGRYKYPKLSEAVRHCLGREMEGAHDAMNDIRATMELYFWIKKNL